MSYNYDEDDENFHDRYDDIGSRFDNDNDEDYENEPEEENDFGDYGEDED